MIAFLSGKIVLQRPGFIILNVNNVGYKVSVSNLSIADKESVELFIHEHIREENDDLYGFTDYAELELFVKLISVNGVGPKAGMAIMTVSAPERIIEAIVNEDVSFFQAVPGIGKKVAAKIILELKSKISGMENLNILGKMEESDELIDAMTSLGYKKSEIGSLISKIPANLSIEEKIRWCLKNISR